MNRRDFLKLAAVPIAGLIPTCSGIVARESSGAYEFFIGGTYVGSVDVEYSAGPVTLFSGEIGRWENIRFIGGA